MTEARAPVVDDDLDPLWSKEDAHAEAAARGAKCAECPLYGQKRGPVMGEIVPGAKLLIVGEAPGVNEVVTGRPFVGRSGEKLEQALLRGGLHRPVRRPSAEVSVTNTILCQPPEDFEDYEARLAHEGKASPTKCCAARLARDISEHLAPYREGPTTATISPVGDQALHAVCAHLDVACGAQRKARADEVLIEGGRIRIVKGEPRSNSIGRQHGSPVLVPAKYGENGRLVHPPVTLVPSYHPAMAMRRDARHWMPVIMQDLARAAAIACRGGAIDWQEPDFWLNPDVDAALGLIERFRASGARVTSDLETDGIQTTIANVRCVGLGAVIDGQEVVAVIPMRRMNGRPWWNGADELRIRLALLRLFEEAPLAGHNFMFDTGVLLNRGLMKNRDKLFFDTMVAHHDTDQSELKHDLGFVAARHLEAPRWKEDADSKVVDGVDDLTLHLYCARDVLGTMRLVPILQDRIARCGTRQQFFIDSKLAPIVRDMRDLGLWVNQAERFKLYDELVIARAQKLAAVRKILGKPDFNPNSPPQVRAWLFQENELTPPLNTKNKPFNPNDPSHVAATSEDALIQILDGLQSTVADAALRTVVEKGIDAILEYRGLDKLLGTYVGLKAIEDEDHLKKLRERGAKIHLDRMLYDSGAVADATLYEDWSHAGWGERAVLHAGWLIHTVVSGRWSSSPNLQNWPERVVLDCYKCEGAAKAAKGAPAIPQAEAACQRCWEESKKPGEEGLGRCAGKIYVNTRAMIEAPPGHVFVGADMEQVELRLYALLAGDELLLDAFEKGLDAHAWNFATMASSDPAEQRAWYADAVARGLKNDSKIKHCRNIAKRFVYLILYGGEEELLFQTMASERTPDGARAFPGLTEKTVHDWFENWHRVHPWTRAWQEGVVRKWYKRGAGNGGWIETELHHRKRFFLGGLDRNAMCNMEIQGTAGDMMNEAAIELWRRIPPRSWSPVTGMRLQMHDYLGVVVPEERAQEAAVIVRSVMERRLGRMNFPCEVKISKSLAKQ